MKKWLALLLVVLALILASIYVFIPSNLTITKVTYITCSSNAAYRFLSDESKWQKWWPHTNTRSGAAMPDTNHSFLYNSSVYTLSSKLYNGVAVRIEDNDTVYKSNLTVLQLSLDSTAIHWECTFASSLNPFKRIQQYQDAVQIKNNMAVILESMRSFLNNRDNVYGIQIQKTSTTDTFLIASRSVYPTYPSTTEIYALINKLRKYAAAKTAKETGPPIINITRVSNTEFELMAAIPTDKELKGNGDIFFRKMIPGNFMAAEVRGGIYTVNEAFNELQLFMDDYQKTEMAIPFELLVTDRSLEPDTSKWITRIYQPAFY